MQQNPQAHQHLTWREKFRHYHHQHERKLEVLFFCLGFAFDIFAAGEGVDHMVMIVQQIIYLSVISFILYMDVLRESLPEKAHQFSPRIERLWNYRGLALHFCLGTLMNLYSIFFLMSSSFFSSIIFVLFLFGALVVNELKMVRQRGADVKVALYVVCMFCFFSLMFPLVISHLGSRLMGSVGVNKEGAGFSPVGIVPFLLSVSCTLGILAWFYRRLRRQVGPRALRSRLLLPGLSMTAAFLLLYFFGLIPPVPLAASKLGVYHGIEKANGHYLLQYERPWWKFWQRGDQDFVARPGDKIYFFAAISSPARFADTVYVRWMFHDRRGWNGSDRIPVTISGGRKEGFRGFTTKQNYNYGDGRWKVSVETADGREIGRMYFDLTMAEADPGRSFLTEVY